MKTAMLAVDLFAAACAGPTYGTAGEGTVDRVYTPAEVEALFLGKGKGELIAAAGNPDRMYGVMGEEGPPLNLSARWEYEPPGMKIVDPGTGKAPVSVQLWFSPGDRVEKVTFVYR